jgi:hypothetical protein
VPVADLRRAPVDLLELRLEAVAHVEVPLELLVGDLALLVQLLESLRRDGLLPDDREDRRVHDRPDLEGHERQAGLLERPLERLHELSHLLLGRLVDRGLARLDGLGRQGLLQLVPDERRQLIDEPLEAPGGAPPEAEQARPVDLREVVHVAAVRRLRTDRAQLLQQALQQRHPAGTGQPAHEDVLPGRARLQPEAERVDGRVLADHAGDRLEFRRVVERKLLVQAAPAQLCARQGRRAGRAVRLRERRSLRHGERLPLRGSLGRDSGARSPQSETPRYGP